MNRHPRATQRAFTLIEVLVVMVIIGLIMTFAVINIGASKDRAVEEEAKRLAALLTLAAEESVLRSTDYVLALGRTDYHFMAWDFKKGTFAELDATDGVFRPRQLPKDMTLGGEINGAPIVFPKEEKGAAKTDKTTGKSKDKSADSAQPSDGLAKDKGATKDAQDSPAVFLFSNGEVMPFTLEIHQDFGATYKVAGGIDGKIKVVAPESRAR